MVNTKYGPPDVLELAEVERPIPRDEEVLLKVQQIQREDLLHYGYELIDAPQA